MHFRANNQKNSIFRRIHFFSKLVPKCLENLVSITLEGFYNIDVDGVQRGLARNLYCNGTYVAEKSFLTELSNFDLSTNFWYTTFLKNKYKMTEKFLIKLNFL